MPRRKSKATLTAENKHLVGLDVLHVLPSAKHEYGRVTELAVADGLAQVVVDFPDSGRVTLAVVRGRKPGRVTGDYIRLGRGEQYGRFRWVDRDAALTPPPPVPPLPPPTPDASFVIAIEAGTWQRTAAKRKQAQAEALTEAIAYAIDDLFGDSPCEVTVSTQARRRDGGGVFDLAVTVDLVGGDLPSIEAMFDQLAYLLDAAAGDDPDCWRPYLAGYDLTKIYASAFTLQGTVGEQWLGPVRGRLLLR